MLLKLFAFLISLIDTLFWLANFETVSPLLTVILVAASALTPTNNKPSSVVLTAITDLIPLIFLIINSSRNFPIFEFN